jgi:asparagine synthase (glutamine-hydrolysing)
MRRRCAAAGSSNEDHGATHDCAGSGAHVPRLTRLSMCGIAGIWNRDGRAVEHRAIESMIEALVHRGPDGAGAHVAGDIGLGHRRLKVIDLSAAAAQPIWLPDRSVCMVYNGEIHNYQELAAQLRHAGAQLRADNDTEVLLWAYRVWGEDCFARLNGMWAAAFWQPAERRLLLSRDRFGIKPLVYSVHGARIAFASEAKALLAAFPQERQPDTSLVHDFVLGAVPDADEHTFFHNIRQLLPGHLLCIEPARERLRQHWNFRPGTEVSRPDAPEALCELLRDAVKIRLRSDVPYGVMLSGGLDSSAVTRLAADESAQALQCFSLRYENSPLDESRFASIVADDPARYQVHWVTPTAENLLATIGSIVWHHDAPTPMRGRYPQWHVLREASRHVTVVLGGQGADELLGGYERFILPFALDRLDPWLAGKYPRWTLGRDLRDLGQIAAGIRRLLPQLIRGAVARRFVAPHGLLHPLARNGAIARRPMVRQRIIGGWTGPTGVRPYRSRLNNALWAEFQCAGLPEVLHSEDAISMAFSLESRLPFLDHRIVEFCFSLPYGEKIGAGWTKLLLRQATAGVLPEPVRWRRYKQGFPGDYETWMASDSGLDCVRALLLDRVSLERGWLDPVWLKRRLGGERSKAAHWARHHVQRVWELVALELWCRQFLDGTQARRWSPAVDGRRAALGPSA